MSEKILELMSVTAGYNDDVVLQDVNLVVKENDFLGVIGPNGGGKTTLLRVMLGVLRPMRGTVWMRHRQGNGSQIGYLPQSHRIDIKFPISVREVVLSGLMSQKKFWARYKKYDRNKVDELLHRLGVWDIRDKNIGELSGGQMQRVFLCRAIVSEPEILILDEPNTYVDSNFENELYKLLEELNRRMAIVMVSHDVGTIFSQVKSIACVNKTLAYHDSNVISKQQLLDYKCPIDILTHGEVPHRVLKNHCD